jgi:TonB family protein
MMKSLVLLLAVTAFFLSYSLGAESASKTLVTPPEFFRNGHLQRTITARGVVLLDVDYDSGTVVKARMLKSTGSAILDKAAVDAFRKYRVKARTSKRFTVPITFRRTIHPKS